MQMIDFKIIASINSKTARFPEVALYFVLATMFPTVSGENICSFGNSTAFGKVNRKIFLFGKQVCPFVF
jgi:hypothetical protein